MLVAKDTVVTLHYRVTDTEGNLIDDGRQPLVYLHGGYDDIFARLEEALQGRAVGDELEIKLQPAEAFGEYDAELVFMEKLSLFPEGIEVGMQFERAGVEGEPDRLFTITDIQGENVVIDGNHPLAGIPLVFRCTIADVRPATPEEIAHGHPHGGGGHPH